MSNFLQLPLSIDLSKYNETLIQIEVLAKALEFAPISDQSKLQVFHHQGLKSALYSARIEGNPLQMNSIKNFLQGSSLTLAEAEVARVYQALDWIKNVPIPLELSHLQKIHQLVMGKAGGQLRNEASAIYDGLGNIIYLTPEPEDALDMLRMLFTEINQSQDLTWQNQLVLAARSHYYFEKIHPFLDGNGRVGRVLLHYQLGQVVILKGLTLPIDQYFEQNRSQYYFYLEKNTRHLDDWVKFFLKGVHSALEMILEDIRQVGFQGLIGNSDSNLSKQPKTNLPPRRQAILDTIRDHPHISADSLQRRFLQTPKRTLNYDLAQLIKAGLIIKLGQTRGVVYEAVDIKYSLC